jgi:predicted nucleotidyltransferase
MTDDRSGIADKWTDVCELLNSRGAVYIVVGGVAVALHGYVRATKDIDILVPRNLENTKRILDALSELPWGMAKELNAEDIDKKPITIIGDDPRVDILKAAHSINYNAAHKNRLTTTVHGTTVPYISLEDLIRSKTGTNRPKDQQDILEVTRALRRSERQRSKRQDQSTRPGEEPTEEKKGQTTKAVVRGHDRQVGGKPRTSNGKKDGTQYRS